MFGSVVEEAKAAFQRRMVVTDNAEDARVWASKLKGLQVGWDSLGLKDFEFLKLSDSKKVLGKTYDNLILDLRGSFSANDLGKLIPTVKGGGVIVILTPPFEKWALENQKYHERLASPPYSVKDCRHIFIPRIIKKLYEHEGIWIKRGGKWEKESLEVPVAPKPKMKFPRGDFPREIYEMARSQDQIDFLHDMETSGAVTVLTANRGRGKSAALGLYVAALRAVRDKKTEIVVVAPSRDGVATLFEFIEKGLKRLGIPYGYKNGILLGKKIKVVFEEPAGALGRNADVFIVDEAAGIPLQLLKELSKKEKVVFSTTIHGYEGSGRTFSIRFMSFLKKKKHVTMEVPIRYGKKDPIEGWLFDTLLLDAEPAPASLGDLAFKSLSPKELFSNEEVLRSVFGLLVSAHYKNRPDDLQILADAPHHSVHIVESKGIVGVVQTAYEGGLSSAQAEELCEGRPEGNVIPGIMCKHYGMKKFARMKGVRIVRIVSHPDFWRQGIGSFALKSLNEAVDWIGASFGSSPELIRFWARNGYLPVALGPYKNPESGEYAVVVVKPQSDSAKSTISLAFSHFSRRFLGSLGDVYWDMEPATVLEILRTFKSDKKLKLDDIERRRIELLISGRHVYELDADIVAKLIEWYFISGGSYLSEEEELAAISKVLQHATWRVVKEKTGVSEVFDAVKSAVEKIYKHL